MVSKLTAEGVNTAPSAAPKKTLSLDLETYSSVDLGKSGAYKYVESPDFEILLFAYSVDGGEVQVVDLASGETVPPEIIAALTDDKVIKWGFNANFERICLSKWLGLPQGQYLDPRSWRCTMVWSAYMGLPLSLEGTGAVLGLEKQKLSEGKDLIRYFCQPCKPTAANGLRTRNLPSHAPDKWERFKAYNRRDVETELSIQQKLARFPVPDSIWAEYHLDQAINDRGVALDMPFVEAAIQADELSRSELTRQMRKLTELENPNSLAQMKAWLAEKGLATDTLGKAAVKDLLKTAPEPLIKVLELRQSLAKSSNKKYTAMVKAACADGRARGMFQFYGANRTGRWAGRIVQLQNLPQNRIFDLEQARSLVRSGNFTALTMLYDSVPVVLSELIRTAFIPKPGLKFIVADFSAIEARVIAWLADETWRNEVFAGHGKIYESAAAKMFNVPVESIGKGHPLRQKGKIAELACIAEGEMVLTDRGLVPIEEITLKHRLWDGEDWIFHGGLIYKGKREVIEYEGLRATPDHFVWVEGQQEPVRFAYAAACGIYLTKTGDGRKELRLGRDNKSRKTLERKNESLLRSYSMHWLWKYSMADPKQSDRRKIKRMPTMFSAKKCSKMAGTQIDSCKTTLRKYKYSKLQRLRRARNSFLLRFSNQSSPMDFRKCRERVSGLRDGSHQQQWKLRTRKYPIYSTNLQSSQSAGEHTPIFQSVGMALCAKRSYKDAFRGHDKKRNYRFSPKSGKGETQKLETYRSAVRVYDIRNAGPRNRFTVSNCLVHNCGYGGSVGALKAMGALDMGLSEEELRPLVTAWRAANPNIVKLWWDVDKAAMAAVRERTTTSTHGIRFECRSGMLFITLPSGRRLAYVKPRIDINQFGSDCVTYEGIGPAKKWERIESYGPKFVENIVQAISRDILCYAMGRLDSAGFPIVMSVHDEVVLEVARDASIEEVCRIMAETPPWAKGLLLRADGYECQFYKKD